MAADEKLSSWNVNTIEADTRINKELRNYLEIQNSISLNENFHTFERMGRLSLFSSWNQFSVCHNPAGLATGPLVTQISDAKICQIFGETNEIFSNI